MPASPESAIGFLETQWSSINENKIKGILAELRFRNYLRRHNHHYVPGGWIMMPGNPSLATIPTKEKICLLPRRHAFSWQTPSGTAGSVTPAEISAYNYFRQVGVKALFATPAAVDEHAFATPAPRAGRVCAQYPRPYILGLSEVGPDGSLIPVLAGTAFRRFPPRNGNIGLRCHASGRIDSAQVPWTDMEVLSDLFWFEYSRYYFQVDYAIANNDLDLFLVGPSGASYPVEIKSKTAANDASLGQWFGIDMGPYAKLSFFTANAMNNDALYVVEEVDGTRGHVE